MPRVKVSADQELNRLRYQAVKIGMRVLTKSEALAWRSKTMALQAGLLQWTVDFSDHARLYFEIEKP